MKTICTKEKFLELDFDDKCAIIESLLPDDYYDAQTEINFFVPEGFTGENAVPLPSPPPDIEKEENLKFEKLIFELTEKLFENKLEIEFDLSVNSIFKDTDSNT